MPPCFKVNRQIRPVNSFFHKTRQKGGKVADATKGRSKRTFYTATATPKRRLFLFAISAVLSGGCIQIYGRKILALIKDYGIMI